MRILQKLKQNSSLNQVKAGIGITLILNLCTACIDKKTVLPSSIEEGGVMSMNGGNQGGAFGGLSGGMMESIQGGNMGGISNETPSAECQQACEDLIECVESDCMQMSMEDQPSLDDLQQACLQRCEDFPAFTSVAQGIDQCSDWITLAQQQLSNESDLLDEICDAPNSSRQEHHVECEDFGLHYARCLIELCPALDETNEVLIGAYTDVCDEQVNLGNADPNQLAFIANDQTSCMSGTLADLIQVRLENRPLNPQSGDLIQVCEDGPLTDAELCSQACENLAPCVPADSDIPFLANRDRCQELCLLYDQPTEQTWECLSEKAECSQQAECFAPVDVPECDSFSDRVVECLEEETCEAFEEIEEGVSQVLRLICATQVGQGILSQSNLSLIGDETSCSNPLVNGYKNYFLVSSPEQSGSGSLETLCEDGLMNDEETCTQACEHLSPCIPEESEAALLRDEAICYYSCRTSSDITPTAWECLFDEAECSGVGQCF